MGTPVPALDQTARVPVNSERRLRSRCCRSGTSAARRSATIYRPSSSRHLFETRWVSVRGPAFSCLCGFLSDTSLELFERFEAARQLVELCSCHGVFNDRGHIDGHFILRGAGPFDCGNDRVEFPRSPADAAARDHRRYGPAAEADQDLVTVANGIPGAC